MYWLIIIVIAIVVLGFWFVQYRRQNRFKDKMFTLSVSLSQEKAPLTDLPKLIKENLKHYGGMIMDLDHNLNSKNFWPLQIEAKVVDNFRGYDFSWSIKCLKQGCRNCLIDSNGSSYEESYVDDDSVKKFAKKITKDIWRTYRHKHKDRNCKL